MRRAGRVLIMAAAVALARPAPVQAQTFETSVSALDVAAGLRKAMGGVVVHLHNHGPIRAGNVHLAEASSIKWPALDGPGRRVRFTLPDASRVMFGRRYGYYVDHVRADGVLVAPQPDRLTATILLSSGGPALIGKCVRQKSPATACERLGDAQMPGIEWTGARLDIDLVPIAYAGSIAFEATGVAIGGTFDVGQACDLPLVGGRVCQALNAKSLALRQKIATEVKASLNQPQVRRDVAAAFRQYLDTVANVPILAVRRVRFADGTMRVTFGLR